MRFEQLNIPAFGPFSDFSLSLPPSEFDVHLIYGANEAGKSSLLRSIRHLFYGIPTRTTDNFLHPNPKLLIGATVSQGKEQLSFFRKKGTRNTLLNESQSTLPDAALNEFLGAVNEDFFEHMFGLDTDSLRKGAAKLLAGEGDLGTAIFSASLGGSPIDEAVKSLEREAHTLCKGASRKDTTILPAIAAFKEAERAAKTESTTATAWKFLKTEIKASSDVFAEKDRSLREHGSRWLFVDSALRAIPVLQAVRDLEAALGALEIPELPADFPVRVRQLEGELARSAQALRLQESRIEKAQESLAEIPEFSSILACSEGLGALHRRAERFHDDRDALPALQSKISALREQLEGAEDLENYPSIRPADMASVKEGAGALAELEQRSGEVARALENLDIELKTHREQLSRLGAAKDLEELEDQCRRLDAFAVDYQSLPGLEAKVTLLGEENKQLAVRLGLSEDPLLAKVPGPKIIQEEERQRQRFVEEIRDLEGRLTGVRDSLSEERAGLSHLASQAAIYSLADLGDSRKERDALWTEICESQSINDDLGEAIKRSDIVADALREDADHIAKAAGFQSKIVVLEARRKDLKADQKKARRAMEDWTAEWESNYAVTKGQSPAELLEWREEWQKLCEGLRQAAEWDSDLQGIRAKEQEFLKELGGSDFSKSHRALKADFNKANREQGELGAIEKLIAKGEIKREQFSGEASSLEGQIEAARKGWLEICEKCGLASDLPPVAGLETLVERSRIREGILQLREQKQELETKANFVSEYEDLLQSTARSLEVSPTESILYGLYEEAVRNQHRAQTIQTQLDELKEGLPSLQLDQEAHLAGLVALRKQAGSEDLETVIVQVEQGLGLTTRLQEQQVTLQNLAGSTPVVDFIAKLDEVSLAGLEEEKATLDEQQERFQGERDAAKAENDAHLRRQEELMKASDAAARHRQAAADALSTIVADTRRFRQLHYAIDFLKQQIEDYRQKTQGPMIEKTSRFFHQLTGGAFSKVAAQLDEKGVPQLIAIRANGGAVETTGLSEGTADQLYLALRFAAIDLHLENHSAIPLILDDLLMTFDDERIAALLPVLRELSRKTQVLIFSHHAHLKGLVGPEVAVHELCGETRSGESDEK